MCQGSVGEHRHETRQEMEIKFMAPAEIMPRLQRQIPRRKAGARKPKTLVSVYFDTDKLKLHERGLTLRVRQDGERRVQTIKAGDGEALTTRGEWERELQSDQPDLKAARGTPVEKFRCRKKVRRAIRPVFETR